MNSTVAAGAALLTPTAITREALRVLHQKLSFVGSITREYDDSFARQGAKVGDTMSVRLPSLYGYSMRPEPSESTAEIRVQTQRGADLSFTRSDLAMPMDAFSERFIDAPMSALAAWIEGDCAELYRDVHQQVDNQGQPASFTKILQARKILVDNLAPLNGRTCNLSGADDVDLSDALRGLFNDTIIGGSKREAFMGRTAGFDFMREAPFPRHTRGSAVGQVVKAAGQGGNSLAVEGGSGSGNKGDVFTIAGVFRVHPETKQSTGVLHQFSLRSASADGDDLTFSPAIVTNGPDQNVNTSPAAGASINWAGAPGEPHGISMAYQKGAFVFASADMVMPRGVDFAAREAFDGVSMRVVRQYDMNAENYPCRFDVLFGREAVKPHLACRLANH